MCMFALHLLTAILTESQPANATETRVENSACFSLVFKNWNWTSVSAQPYCWWHLVPLHWTRAVLSTWVSPALHQTTQSVVGLHQMSRFSLNATQSCSSCWKMTTPCNTNWSPLQNFTNAQLGSSSTSSSCCYSYLPVLYDNHVFFVNQ